ncbi:hypothetical protein SY83_09915 [Paenibacillus swuensis]|uniref:Uncharacterized protein n=1 Tax=Paenibacillus swuensis TaxID=1178515 RepID=A0A172TIC9_9BACL|nr:hypothetical protein [Paenibacillus swuensis]ANE46543.1 hypothetical protein SY83_09915 [Paenibacillus swuensis]
MSKPLNEQELIQYIAGKTGADPTQIGLVLKIEDTYINKAKANARGEVDIDVDDIVDHIMKQRDVNLDEMTVETILETEMEYLIQKGIATYGD